MRESVRFAASFFSVWFALAAHGADVRVLKDPAQLDALFPRKAALRVVNVWATWCGPCVAEMSDFRLLDEMFGPEVAFVGVSLDNLLPGVTKEKVAAFLDKERIAYPNVFYTGKPDALGDRLVFSGEIPITIVYDGKGKEVWRHDGRIDRNQTIAQLRELLRRKR